MLFFKVFILNEKIKQLSIGNNVFTKDSERLVKTKLQTPHERKGKVRSCIEVVLLTFYFFLSFLYHFNVFLYITI